MHRKRQRRKRDGPDGSARLSRKSGARTKRRRDEIRQREEREQLNRVSF